MNKTIRYADLWALLRKLGFNCDTLDDRNHRICEFAPTDTRIVLHDYPPHKAVRPEILIGIRLQLDNGSVMSRADFKQWASRESTRTATESNGAKPRRPRKKTPADAT
jgi:hypothetical protein